MTWRTPVVGAARTPGMASTAFNSVRMTDRDVTFPMSHSDIAASCLRTSCQSSRAIIHWISSIGAGMRHLTYRAVAPAVETRI